MSCGNSVSANNGIKVCLCIINTPWMFKEVRAGLDCFTLGKTWDPKGVILLNSVEYHLNKYWIREGHARNRKITLTLHIWNVSSLIIRLLPSHCHSWECFAHYPSLRVLKLVQHSSLLFTEGNRIWNFTFEEKIWHQTHRRCLFPTLFRTKFPGVWQWQHSQSPIHCRCPNFPPLFPHIPFRAWI